MYIPTDSTRCACTCVYQLTVSIYSVHTNWLNTVRYRYTHVCVYNVYTDWLYRCIAIYKFSRTEEPAIYRRNYLLEWFLSYTICRGHVITGQLIWEDRETMWINECWWSCMRMWWYSRENRMSVDELFQQSVIEAEKESLPYCRCVWETELWKCC